MANTLTVDGTKIDQVLSEIIKLIIRLDKSAKKKNQEKKKIS